MTRRISALAFSFTLLFGLAAARAALADAGMPSLAPIIKKATPAVVNISTRGVIKRQIQGPFMNPLFQQFFGIPPNQTMEEPFESLGSGVVVNAEKGYILTNYHVIRDAKKITVTLYDNRTFTGKVVGYDKDTDIAVVKIDAKNLTQIPLGDSAKLQVGDYVVAIGNPFGLEHTATFGIVSALGRPAERPENSIGSYDDFIQTDAAINPGNSGGALINLQGELVGINSAIVTASGGNNGIGFAIPVDMAKTVMDQLIKYGKVERGLLGVEVQPLTPAVAGQLKLKEGQGGAIITQVVPGSAAEKAGLKQYDVITAVNGQPVTGPNMLRSYVGIQRIGTPLELTVYRDGKRMTVHAKVGPRTGAAAAESSASAASTGHPSLGATFGEISQSSSLYGKVHGVEVKTVQPDGEAANAGLQPGDVITAVDQRPVRNLADFRDLMRRLKGTVLLTVRRDDQVFITTIR